MQGPSFFSVFPLALLAMRAATIARWLSAHHAGPRFRTASSAASSSISLPSIPVKPPSTSHAPIWNISKTASARSGIGPGGGNHARRTLGIGPYMIEIP
jgi:hypothetical protein